MMAFNLFSHGTQDLYPTFLQKQLNLAPATVSWITIVANLGAIAGGLSFGYISEKIGRVNAITIAALIALPALPLWPFRPRRRCWRGRLRHADRGAGRVGRGAGPSQRTVARRGARDLAGLRLSGGNFLASYNGPFQAKLAEAHGGDIPMRWRWSPESSRSRSSSSSASAREARETLHAH